MFQHQYRATSFYLLFSIPLYRCIILYLANDLLMGTRSCFQYSLLRIILQSVPLRHISLFTYVIISVEQILRSVLLALWRQILEGIIAG